MPLNCHLRALLVIALALTCAPVAIAEENLSHLPLDDVNHVEIYKQADGVTLRLLFLFPANHDPAGKRPAALFFFGGGWNGGSPSQFLPHARYLASRGMIGVLADYRVKSRNGTDPFACVEDGKSAVRWLRAHAAEFGIDPGRIAAGGGSAGGHVAAATGVLPGLDAPEEDAAVSSKPNALLLFNPVFDNGPDGYGYDRVADRYLEISPLHNIAPGAPPSIIFLGSEDKLIPVSTAEAYKKKMTEADSRCDLFIYEGQGHGFFNENKAGKEYYVKTVREMDRFLISLGYLEGEPTIALEEEAAADDAG